MKMKKNNVKNKTRLDSRQGLFTVAESFQKIQCLIEKAKKDELQKEELKDAIKDILRRTELYGQILPFTWENFTSLEELERVIVMAKISFEKPVYIV